MLKSNQIYFYKICIKYIKMLTTDKLHSTKSSNKINQ